LVPLPPSLLDYTDLVPDGVLLALRTFIPTPVLRVLRSQAQQPQLNKEEKRTGEPTLLLLRKELVESKTLLDERDGALDKMEKAMEMLSEETQLWVRRCEEMVEVLKEVEMERDNYKAGEGVAKALGKGVTVKLEEMDLESGTTATWDLATELANTKTELADIKAELADTKAQLFNKNQDLNRSEAALSQSAIQLAADAAEMKAKNEKSLARDHELQVQIQTAELRATVINEKNAALAAMAKDRDLAWGKLRGERDGSKKQLDEMKAKEFGLAETNKLAVDEVKEVFQKQLNETKVREAEALAKISGLERDLNDMTIKVVQFRSFAIEMYQEFTADADAAIADLVPSAENPTSTQAQGDSTRAQGDRSAPRLRLDSLWASKKAFDNHQHDETCKRNPSSEPVTTPCDTLHAKLSEAVSAHETSRNKLSEIAQRWLDLKESPTSPAELESVEVAFENCDVEVGMAVLNCLRVTSLVNYHQMRDYI
jgi:hypothetical protein